MGPRISNRDELIFYLMEAAELEHLLCCSYLYAALTLRNGEEDGLTAAQTSVVARWKRQILDIAIQEMGHLSAVSNLLTAVGGAPHFQRPNFPQQGKYYPSHLHLTLAPFSEETLDRFIALERPDEVSPAAEISTERSEARATPDSEVLPEPQGYPSVGALYRGVELGLKDLVDRYGEANVFIGPPSAQLTMRQLPFHGFEPVLGLDAAVAALAQIVEEGEGSRGDRTDTHYGRFLAVRRELQQLTEADPSFAPAFAALVNPSSRRPSDAVGVALVQHPDTVHVMDLFNASYALMVQMLARYFTRGGESEEELETLLDVAITLMTSVLTPIGELLVRLPAKESDPVPTAGPSFEFHRAIQALPHARAAWRRFGERLAELADFAERLHESAPPHDRLPHVRLIEAARSLRDLAGRFS